MIDVRALQVMLDGGVTDPRALFAALLSGTPEDANRAIDVLSCQALTPAEELDRETLLALAEAADYMACESEAADRNGRCAAYLTRAANAARAAAAVDPSSPTGRRDA